MPVPNTFDSLRRALSELGLRPGMIVMVHSSLGQAGWTVGGPVTVIRALSVGVAVDPRACASAPGASTAPLVAASEHADRTKARQ